MKFSLRVYGDLRRFVKDDQEMCARLERGSTVGDLIRALTIPVGESRSVWVNGRKVGEDEEIRDGDEIVISSPIAGGIS